MNDISEKRKLQMLVGEWVGMADRDEEWERFRNIDPENKQAVKAELRRDIVPHFKELSAENQELALQGLDYALTLSDEEAAQRWNGILPPFSPPKKAREIYVWLHEVFHEEGLLD